MSGRPSGPWIEALLVGLLGAAVAQAQPSDRARAEQLFEDGKRLMDAGKVEEACPKLEQSYQLVQGGGSALALGLCLERVGKWTRAQGVLREAMRLAHEKGNGEREAIARDKLASLEARMSRLAVLLPADAAGARVQVDGAPAPEPLGQAHPIDPGRHEVVVTMAGRESWTQGLQVNRTRELIKLSVPPFVPEVSASTSSSEAVRPAPTPSDGRLVPGVILASAGAVSAGLGVYFALSAHGKHADAQARCPRTTCSDLGAIALERDANTAAWGANIGLGLGLVGLGLGGYLLATHASTAPRVNAALGRQGGGVSVSMPFLPRAATTTEPRDEAC